MKITKLTNNKCDFPTKEITRFDPFKEYFVLDEEQKKCFILRNTKDNKIMLVNLKYASSASRVIEDEDFSKLCEDYTLLELPHYSGGCSGYTQSVQDEENKARKEMYQYLIDNGYFN